MISLYSNKKLLVVVQFNEIHKTQDGRSLLLTGEQEQWLQIQELLASVKPIAQHTRPDGVLRKRLFTIVNSQWFDAIVMGMILINIAFLSMAHANMSPEWSTTLFVASVAFTLFFLVEGAAKLFALGVKAYFQVCTHDLRNLQVAVIFCLCKSVVPFTRMLGMYLISGLFCFLQSGLWWMFQLMNKFPWCLS